MYKTKQIIINELINIPIVKGQTNASSYDSISGSYTWYRIL